jgi:ferritin
MKTELISKECISGFEDALYREMYVSHLYRHISNQMQMIGYLGAFKFFQAESADELTHFQTIVNFLNDVGILGGMPAMPACEDKVDSIGDALAIALESEIDLLNFYSDFYKKADPICQEILLDFIKIQRKAVGEYGDLMARYEILKDDTCGFIIFDQELANGL